MPVADVVKINARDWTFELSDGAAIPVFVQIGGVTSVTMSRSSTNEDTTDFDSGGTDEHEIMSRGRTFSIEGRYLMDPADGARDPGQAAVEALADALTYNSLRELRITDPAGGTSTQEVSAELGSIGGGTNSKTSWSATFTRSGATVTV